MSARYQRLIFGLLVFLALMLMIGRIHIDTTREPPLPPEIRARQALSRIQEAQAAEHNRNPYRHDPAAHAACQGTQTAEALQELRQQRSMIISATRFADARDRDSLAPLQAITSAMRERTLPGCLHRARLALYDAAYNAQGVLIAQQDHDINVFVLREKIQAAMRHNLDTAEQEFALVDEALQYP
jgi:hypothetical protein